MNDPHPADEAALFAEALRQPAGQRASFLEHACGGDGAARRRLKALLRAHDHSGDFLERPPFPRAAEPTPSLAAERAGGQIGRYKLLRQIGEGGCGVVFMAEQQEPVRRRVALKIIKPGMDTRSVIARFEAERQALALMDHPNIAKVFDAGATDSGRPYFVMELIRGEKITTYCDERGLAVDERLELFIQVCQAVHHAHQKGIIHRDLKPSNVLVTQTLEGQALPVVIDFGIAKAAAGQPLTEKTLFTALEMLVGTPAYMSPEQAAFAGAGVDTRSDIYSLGVLLYELLTGSTPFDSAALRQAGLDEIRRVIREKEPAAPSARLGALAAEELAAVARQRRAEPPGLIRSLRGDLDWIVLKALEKDASRRYETAGGFAEDVKRRLAHEAVSAHPPSRRYRFRKAVRRHKRLAFFLVSLALLGAGSLAVVLASLGRETQARRRAQTEEARSRQATQFLKHLLEGVGPAVARGRDTEMLREMLDRTADGLGARLGGQPAVEAEMRHVTGRLYLDIGNYEGAEAMLQAALALSGHLGPESAETAAIQHDLGVALWRQRKLAEAEAAHGAALAIRRQLFGPAHPETASSLNELGAVHRRQRRLAEAEALTRESLAIRRQHFGPEHVEVADSLRNLSIILRERDQKEEAEAAAREMTAMRRRLLGDEHPLVAAALADLAWVVGYSGDHREAEALEAEAFAIRRKILGDDHPEIAKSIYALGGRMRQQEKYEESHAVLRAALSIQRKLLGEAHPDVLATLRNLGLTLEDQRRWAEAEALHREALAAWRQQAAADSPRVIEQIEALARVLMEQGRLDEAAEMLGEALTPDFSRLPASANLLGRQTEILARLGRWEAAAAAGALLIQHRPEDHYAHHQLAPLLALTHQRGAYDELCRALLEKFSDTDDPYIAERVVKDCLLWPAAEADADAALMSRLAGLALAHESSPDALPYFQTAKALAECRAGRFTEAIRWGEKALAGPEPHAQAHALGVLALAHWRLGGHADARACLERGEALAGPPAPADWGRNWVARLFARLTLDEAAALMRAAAERPAE